MHGGAVHDSGRMVADMSAQGIITCGFAVFMAVFFVVEVCNEVRREWNRRRKIRDEMDKVVMEIRNRKG